MNLLLNAASHLLVDGVCLATLFGAGADSASLMTAVMLYNTLAFSTQCIVGLWTDKSGLDRRLQPCAMLLVAAGFFLPLPFLARVALIGLGNSFFHVCAGSVTLKESNGRAAPLGVFVAPGALGVVLGRLYPQLGTLFAALLAAGAFVVWMTGGKEALQLEDEAGPDETTRQEELPSWRQDRFPLLAAAALTSAVAVRAVGGCCADFPWSTGVMASLLTAFFVFSGKFAGGFVCERLGAARASMLSIVPAAVLIAFCSFSMPASLLGQFLLNLSMPITLWLLYKLMPKDPGFAFGLAASALWPGTLLGLFLRLTGPAQKALILACFVLGLAAIVYTLRLLNGKENSK